MSNSINVAFNFNGLSCKFPSFPSSFFHPIGSHVKLNLSPFCVFFFLEAKRKKIVIRFSQFSSSISLYLYIFLLSFFVSFEMNINYIFLLHFLSIFHIICVFCVVCVCVFIECTSIIKTAFCEALDVENAPGNS